LVALEEPMGFDRPFGRTVLPIGDALRFIAYEDIFWVMT
jgi:hypothetical protein